MAHRLPIAFTSRIQAPESNFRDFELETEVGRITVRGHLSTGSRGWRLRAEAARRRSVITVQVTAIETEPERLPDLEHHEYEAVIDVGSPGRFNVRVAHSFLLREVGGQGMPRPVFEESAAVPPPPPTPSAAPPRA
ncbi:MAG: hypothetical protein R2882_04175 [Gemmatimonadales bacterium]